MLSDAKFLFVVCQVGAEAALKTEVARIDAALRFAFSRPGFVTFKLPPGRQVAEDYELAAVLARTSGFSVGKVKSESAETCAAKTWEMVAEMDFDHLHVWQRDTAIPGDRGFEPGISPLADEVGKVLLSARSKTGSPPPLNKVAKAKERVLDCVLVEPNEWWIGFHVAGSMPSRWPGGVPKVEPPDECISRAYWKINEAIEWSRLPMKAGEECAEIGSAPGGAAQALLERGLRVIGIDPADMDEEILAHPNFRHIRARAIGVRRREFRDTKWLIADANVAPKNTLDSVEGIVSHGDVRVRGMLLTLKLSNWTTAEQIPQFMDRVRSWGFGDVRVRQLAFNRREVCLAARRLETGRQAR